MLFTMLFEDSERELKERTAQKNAPALTGDTVTKGSVSVALLYPAFTVLLAALGVLTLVLHPIPQYHAAAICLFAAALVPVFFLIEFLVFRITVGSGKISLRKLGAPTTVYAYADLSWQMQTPDGKRSAIAVYAKGKQIARVLYGAKNYAVLTTLRHKGPLKEGEKRLLSTLGNGKT